MRTIFNSCSQFAAGDHPDFIVTDQTNFERYEKTLQPQERFTSNKEADGGFMNLLFKNVPLYWDTYCTANRMYFVNTEYLELVVHKDANITPSEFVKPDNQDAKIAQILWMGELTAANCAKHGIMTISAA